MLCTGSVCTPGLALGSPTSAPSLEGDLHLLSPDEPARSWLTQALGALAAEGSPKEAGGRGARGLAATRTTGTLPGLGVLHAEAALPPTPQGPVHAGALGAEEKPFCTWFRQTRPHPDDPASSRGQGPAVQSPTGPAEEEAGALAGRGAPQGREAQEILARKGLSHRAQLGQGWAACGVGAGTGGLQGTAWPCTSRRAHAQTRLPALERGRSAAAATCMHGSTP